jgi:hypothetical protein
MTGKLLAVALGAIALIPIAFAQDEEGPYVYVTYFVCDVEKQWLADLLVETYDAQAFNGAMEDQSISGWGWLAHHTGGQWRRVSYYIAPTLDALLDAQQAVDARRQALDAPPEIVSAFGEACPAHDDYIWQLITGSQGDEMARERGDAALSVYHVCNMAEEDRADELVESTFAPLYDAQVKKGNLDTWGWMQHVAGGKYRRLETLTGKDHKSILKARGEIIEQMIDKHEAAGDEFTSICGSHSDYLWDIVHES